jgi:predicted small lipoprotein YifL
MRGKMIPLLLILVIAMGLTACGNKGPLTLPDEDEKTKQAG